MANIQNLKLNYSLKIFQNSTDDKFLESLDVYIKSVSRIEKTSTNEIIWCIDNADKFNTFNLFFLGLELNNKVIGYSEIAFIKRTRYITIDYLSIDGTYRTHSAFYAFLWLIIDYFSKLKLDYDFIGIELLIDDNGVISKEELTEFELEGFKVVNTLYVQPCLELNNRDSQHKALLLIYQRNTSNEKISKDTYLDIIHSIYFDYYFEWDSHFFSDNAEKSENYNKLQQTYETIKSSLSEEYIVLNGYPYSKMSSENKVIPNDKTINRKLWQALFFTMAFEVLALSFIYILKIINIELTSVGVGFVLLLFTWLAFLSFSENKAYSILSKIPVLSKFFGNTE